MSAAGNGIHHFQLARREVVEGLVDAGVLLDDLHEHVVGQRAGAKSKQVGGEPGLANNLEAAEEIGRQLRLRDIGGIIVIDFIDMESVANQQAVLRRLKETLARDKTRTQVFEVSSLGLVEMTRKNVSAGLLEQFSTKCEHCAGRGVIINDHAGAHVGVTAEDYD
jgi:Rne/Rng family ribonuclease